MTITVIQKPHIIEETISIPQPVPFLEQIGIVKKKHREDMKFSGRREFSNMIIKGDEIIVYKQDLTIDGIVYLGVIPLKHLPDGSVECCVDGMVCVSSIE